MFNHLQQYLSKIVNRNSGLKKSLLKLYDIYHKFLPYIVGYFTRYPAYFYNIVHSKVIAKPGMMGFKGGFFNPGALVLEDNNILLLAKSQILPWYKARGKNRKYYLKGSPVVFTLDNNSLKTKKNFIVKDFINFPETDHFAIEDFRLFKWDGKILINHSWIVREENVDLSKQQLVKSAISELNVQDQTIKFCAFPKVDFPVQEIEKNWVYKQKGGELLLFYSVNPYRVLQLEDKNEFNFKTIINEDLLGSIKDPGRFGTRVSFSTNPIDFDERHWLIIIHQIKFQLTGRCYFHWAVLIDKETLLPTKITSKPIFSGMGARGRVPGYRYISSILKQDNEILFFAGEGDIYVTVIKKKIQDIEKLLIEI